MICQTKCTKILEWLTLWMHPPRYIAVSWHPHSVVLQKLLKSEKVQIIQPSQRTIISLLTRERDAIHGQKLIYYIYFLCVCVYR